MLWSDVLKEAERIRKSGGAVQPSPGDVHVNRPLTNISIAYMQDSDSFIADRAFPSIPVMKQSDAYFQLDRDAWLRSMMEERAPATEASAATYMISTDTYFAKRYALAHDIADEVRVNADQPLSLDMNATQFLTQQAMIQRETFFQSSFLKDSVWTLGADGAASATAAASVDWSDSTNNKVIHWNAANSVPIYDVKEWKRAVQERTGFRPNVMLMGRKVFDRLTEHEDVIERLNRGQTVGPAQANKDDLMRLFELEDILIMDAIQNTSIIGKAAAYSFVNETDALLLYRPRSPGLLVPSAGYMFAWTGMVGMGAGGARIRRFRMQLKDADRIEIDTAYTFKVVSPDLGFWIDGIVE